MPECRPLAVLLLSVLPTLLAAPAWAQAEYELEVLYTGLEKPVSVLAIPNDGMLLASLDGRVYLLRDGVVRGRPVLDLVLRVTALRGEQGMFSVALEPTEAAAAAGRDRWMVAAFTERETGDLLVSAFPFDGESLTADPSHERVVLRVPMPEPYHHGGQVRFGPDGLLWVSVGNGELSNRFLRERPFTSQDLSSLRGKLLRLDLSGAASGDAYAVPPDNPFVGAPGARPEVYAYGFRNPWKFAFHPVTGDVLMVDVGNDRWEEVNRVQPGGDHGWPRREGHECQHLPDGPGLVDEHCEATIDVGPVHAYGHLALDPSGGQAITGGAVFVDPPWSGPGGVYLFADFVVGRVWALDLATQVVTELIDTDLPITEVARGPTGEALVVSVSGTVALLRAVR